MALQINEMQVTLARALANPDKGKRDRTVQTLHTYITGNDFTDLEMLVLWKALHYCLWLADKSAVQLELCASLANLIHACKNEIQALQFLRCFLQTVMREWGSLDYHRVNKFYSLIRVFLRETLRYLHLRGWQAELTNDFVTTLEKEVLNKQPNGPRMHVADIFLSELYIATSTAQTTDVNASDDGNTKKANAKDSKTKKAKTEKKPLHTPLSNPLGVRAVTDTVFSSLLRPFLLAVAAERDHIYRSRVMSAVFFAFAEKHARENDKSGHSEETARGKKKPKKTEDADAATSVAAAEIFSAVDTKQLQGKVFATASSEGVSSVQRQDLYSLHEKLQRVTSVQFVEGEFEALAVPALPQSKTQKAAAAAQAARNQSVTMNDDEDDEEEDDEEDDEEEDDDEEEEEEEEDDEEEEEVVAVKPGSKRKHSQSMAAQPLNKSQPSKSVPKVEPIQVTAVAASSVSKSPSSGKPSQNPSAAIVRPAIVTTNSGETDNAPFIASTTFKGAKPGYVFHNGKEGVGYYIDTKAKNKAGTKVGAGAVAVPAETKKETKHVHFSPKANAKSKR